MTNVLPSLRVDGKRAVVTGAGSGIGRAVAIALSEAGADVALSELPDRLDSLQEVCEAIELNGQKAVPLPLALPQTDSIDTFVADAIEGLGGIDILVNNAGVNIPADAFDLTEQDWDQVQDVNLKGLFFLSQRCGRHMRDHGGGRIVNMASINGVVG
ncbi:MAG: SDR family oxidoreductase, partial [Gemmatimonadetes bacterium]|nr:SDR family oxidoreductase [Gemmatimonadota bacterium]